MSQTNDAKFVTRKIGLTRVIEELELRVPSPAVSSTVAAGARKTRVEKSAVHEQYPKTYAAEGLFENLKFAMRYEPIDLGVYRAAFEKIEPETVAEWVRGELTGIYTRRIWYLYELLTGKVLDVPDVPPTGYADLLNPKIHFTGKPIQIRRQRINDNLLGNRDYCPLIRRTDIIESFIAEDLEEEAKKIIEETDPIILARAVSYLYTRETKSSFAIEGETPGKNRSERFIAALARAAEFDAADKSNFIELQNKIVDPRFAAKDWRDAQNFVGQTMPDYSEQVHFVCPKPEDVPDLMDGWMRFIERAQNSEIDAVAAAAAISFGFVFIHPFEDGNGRIHRFLIHHELARSGFAPQNLIFPVSAVMLRELGDYDRILESFSKPTLEFIEYDLNERGEMTIENETAHLYRYWDATRFVEFLYHCVSETIRRDLRDDLGFLNVFDGAMRAVAEIVDMPDRRASLLVRMILQNRGELSKKKRASEFPELSDDEILSIEAAIMQLKDMDSI